MYSMNPLLGDAEHRERVRQATAMHRVAHRPRRLPRWTGRPWPHLVWPKVVWRRRSVTITPVAASVDAVVDAVVDVVIDLTDPVAPVPAGARAMSTPAAPASADVVGSVEV